MAKLTEAVAIAALKDVHRNDGMMWEPPTGYAAKLLWDELRRRGWVKGSVITPAGRAALEDEKE